jgi:hypothetical protein
VFPAAERYTFKLMAGDVALGSVALTIHNRRVDPNRIHVGQTSRQDALTR